MDYQEIVTKYEEDSLAINNIEKKLKIARLLEARPRYRALAFASQDWYYYSSITDLITTKEDSKKLDFFKKKSRSLMSEYFNEIIERIKQTKAWNFMGIKAKDFSKEKFEEVEISQKFAMIYELNQRYCKFLEYQKLADLRDMFADKNVELDEQTVKKICFLKLMFENFKNKNIKTEFFCFDEKFLHALLKYKSSKSIRIDDHMKNQKKAISDEYKKFEKLNFFSVEDYRDIIDNISIVSNTTKLTKTQIIRIYSQMSETEAEQNDLRDEIETFRELEKKYQKMNKIKEKYEDEQIKEKDEIDKKEARIKLEETKKKLEEAKLKAERERKIAKNEGYTGNLDSKITQLQHTLLAKETVIPVFLIWLDKENQTLNEKIGSKKTKEFFAKLKEIERERGERVSLFLITNADKKVTKKRIENLRKISDNEEMPRIVEGALGGYSSFKIDAEGNVKDVAQMSLENRKKIALLLEKSLYTNFPASLIDETEENYIRYKFANKPSKNITKQYLTMLIGRLLNDERVKKQPLRFMPFIEKSAVGVDVLLESQLKGISKIHEYYESKYFISPGKSYKVNVESINQFLEDKENQVEV